MSGRRPIEFIQATKPDRGPRRAAEHGIRAQPPQRSPASTRSARSATRQHTSRRTTASYRLGPVDAYDMNLVKRIEVASVVADENPNAAFVRLYSVDVSQGPRASHDQPWRGAAFRTKKVWVKCGDDLAVASDGRQEYADGLDRLRHLVPSRRRGGRVHQRVTRSPSTEAVGILRRGHRNGRRSSRRSASTSTRSGRSRRSA